MDGRLVGTAAMYPIDYVVGGVHIRLIGNGNVAVAVMISGYDPGAAERCKDVAEVAIQEPALFRILQPEKLRQAAISLGLDENTLYAPYLT